MECVDSMKKCQATKRKHRRETPVNPEEEGSAVTKQSESAWCLRRSRGHRIMVFINSSQVVAKETQCTKTLRTMTQW